MAWPISVRESYVAEMSTSMGVRELSASRTDNCREISSAVSTVLRAEVCARAMGDWRSIVDTAIWTKPTERLWVLNGVAVVRRLENAVLREAPEGQGTA